MRKRILGAAGNWCYGTVTPDKEAGGNSKPLLDQEEAQLRK